MKNCRYLRPFYNCTIDPETGKEFSWLVWKEYKHNGTRVPFIPTDCHFLCTTVEDGKTRAVIQDQGRLIVVDLELVEIKIEKKVDEKKG